MAMDSQLLRNTEQRYVTIQNVDMANNIISAVDQHGQIMNISSVTQDAVATVPAPDEIWLVQQRNHLWYLISKRDDGTEITALDDLDPGDKRVEAANNLYLNGVKVVMNADQVVVNGEDLEQKITDVLAESVILAPDSATRNIIQPTIDTVPLSLKLLTSGVANILEFIGGAGTRVAFISSTGGFNGVTATTSGLGSFNTLSAGASTLAATTVSSLNAGSGTIQTTGSLQGGATTVGSLNAGSGAIVTTGTLGAGTTTLGATTLGATTATTLGTSGLATLNSASVTTTLGVTGTSTLGTLNAGATTVTSLNAGSGLIQTTGAITGSAITGTTGTYSGTIKTTATPGFNFNPASAAGTTIKSTVGAEANDRFNITFAGIQNWGPGSTTATDTNLYRLSAGALKTDGTFTAAGGFVGLTGSTSSTLSGANTDVAYPGGQAVAYFTAVTTVGGSIRTVGAPPTTGVTLAIRNGAGSGILTLLHNTSGTGVKFFTRNLQSILLQPNETAEFIYDGSFWVEQTRDQVNKSALATVTGFVSGSFAPVTFGVVAFDDWGSFLNTSSNFFTIPAPGRYLVVAGGVVGSQTGAGGADVRIDRQSSSGVLQDTVAWQGINFNDAGSCSAIVNFLANDRLVIQATNAATGAAGSMAIRVHVMEL